MAGVKGQRKEARTAAKAQRPYGYVLVLRALASAAIELRARHPATMCVLNVLADYMDQDGKCAVGHHAIADRLQISRQAVQKHIDYLIGECFLSVQPGSGVGKTMRYKINTAFIEEERDGQDRVDAGRAARRQARRKHREAEAVIAGTDRPDTAAVAAERQLPENPAIGQKAESDQRSAPPVETFESGDYVYHPKFGFGRVEAVDGTTVAVMFQNGYQKRVVAAFLERAVDIEDRREGLSNGLAESNVQPNKVAPGATSDVASLATSNVAPGATQ